MPISDETVASFLRLFPHAKQHEPLASHTTWRMGGPARLFLQVSSVAALLQAIDFTRQYQMPWAILGGGTNVLVADEGFDGLVLQIDMREIRVEGETVRVDAGALTSLVARQSVAVGLSGFEWAVTLPGTIGGAVFGNAGCYGGEMKDAVASVDAYRVSEGKCVTFTNEDCQFGYRDSRFKWESFIILGCSLRLTPSPDAAALQKKMTALLARRQKEQPLGFSSAGSVFKNYAFTSDDALSILRRAIQEIPSVMLAQKRLAAGWLVEQSGMKGYRIGQMQVSEQHGNFFTNLGGAKAQDAAALISVVKRKVHDLFGVQLQEEIRYLGF